MIAEKKQRLEPAILKAAKSKVAVVFVKRCSIKQVNTKQMLFRAAQKDTINGDMKFSNVIKILVKNVARQTNIYTHITLSILMRMLNSDLKLKMG